MAVLLLFKNNFDFTENENADFEIYQCLNLELAWCFFIAFLDNSNPMIKDIKAPIEIKGIKLINKKKS